MGPEALLNLGSRRSYGPASGRWSILFVSSCGFANGAGDTSDNCGPPIYYCLGWNIYLVCGYYSNVCCCCFFYDFVVVFIRLYHPSRTIIFLMKGYYARARDRFRVWKINVISPTLFISLVTGFIDLAFISYILLLGQFFVKFYWEYLQLDWVLLHLFQIILVQNPIKEFIFGTLLSTYCGMNF